MLNCFAKVILVFALISSTTEAADYHTPRSAGLGGAGRAGAGLNDAIYLNPSYLGFLKNYSIQGNFLWFKGEPHGRTLNVSLQDGTSDLFAAGLGYTIREDIKFFTLGAARAILPRLSVGLGGKYVMPKNDAPNAIDFSASATFVVTHWLQVALIVDNLFETPELSQWRMSREFSLGSKFTFDQIFMIYADPHYAPAETDAFGYDLGLEFALMTDFSLKLGRFYNSSLPFFGGARGEGYSVGAGWYGPKLALDGSILRVLDPTATTTYNVGATVYF